MGRHLRINTRKTCPGKVFTAMTSALTATLCREKPHLLAAVHDARLQPSGRLHDSRKLNPRDVSYYEQLKRIGDSANLTEEGASGAALAEVVSAIAGPSTPSSRWGEGRTAAADGDTKS